MIDGSLKGLATIQNKNKQKTYKNVSDVRGKCKIYPKFCKWFDPEVTPGVKYRSQFVISNSREDFTELQNLWSIISNEYHYQFSVPADHHDTSVVPIMTASVVQQTALILSLNKRLSF